MIKHVRISPHKQSQSYAKDGWVAFILYPICKAKSLSKDKNFLVNMFPDPLLSPRKGPVFTCL